MTNFHVDPPLRLLSICSGIGAADLACSRLGLRLVGAVERQAYAAAVLLARMEEAALDPAPVWCGDVRDLDARPLRGWADVVAAGIPCVAWSLAGQRRGADDERHLGHELVRIVGEVEPAYVIVENVPGFAVRSGLGALLGQLSELGFNAEWDCFTAAQVGAPHIRERLFVVASHADRARLPDESGQRHATGRNQSADSVAADSHSAGRTQERRERLLDRERAARRDDTHGCGWDRWHGWDSTESSFR